MNTLSTVNLTLTDLTYWIYKTKPTVERFVVAKKKEAKIMNDNQKKFLNELAQFFEKYSITSAYVTDRGFELKSHEETLSFQSYKDDTFFNVKTYCPEYDVIKEKEME